MINKNIVKNPIDETPLAKPLIQSNQLIAFINHTNQMIVRINPRINGMFHRCQPGSVNSLNPTPDTKNEIHATVICASSLNLGLTCLKLSINAMIPSNTVQMMNPVKFLSTK